MSELSWLRHRRRHLEYQAVDHFIQRGSIVADVGAHRGTYTARMARLVGPPGHVHAFEPNPENLQELGRMASKRLTIHETALSAGRRSGSLRVPLFHDSENSGMGSLEAPKAKQSTSFKEVPISAERLDDALADVARVDFMKIDVEGHEHAVLQGGPRLLERDLPVLLVEIEQRHRDQPIGDTFELLLNLGYKGWAFFADAIRPLESFETDRDQLRYLAEITGEHVPQAYVHNFLFTTPGAPTGRLPVRP
jgi:FkbM family methyltransferase